MDNFIDSLDLESPDRLAQINKRSRNAFMSEDNSAGLSKGDCLDENLLNGLSQLAPWTKNSQVCQFRVVTSQPGYGKSQKGGENCWKNKINPFVGKKSNTETNVCYYVINRY